MSRAAAIWGSRLARRGRPSIPVALATLLLGAFAMGFFWPPGAASAAGSVAWTVSGLPLPSQFAPGERGVFNLEVMNTGSEASAEGVTLTDRLPAGSTWAGAESHGNGEWSCGEVEPAVVQCTLGEALPAGGYAPTLAMAVVAPEESAVPLENRVTVSGAGASVAAATSERVLVGTAPRKFGISLFSMEARTAGGEPSSQAGGHPWQLTTSLGFSWDNAVPGAVGEEKYRQVENVKKVAVELPAGLVGNLLSSSEHCTQTQLNTFHSNGCPVGSRVGSIAFASSLYEYGEFKISPDNFGGPSYLYSMAPEPGYPAQLGFSDAQQVVYLDASVVHSAEGERVRLTTVGIPAGIETGAIIVTVWGDPGAFNGTGSGVALLSNPTSCSGSPLMGRVEAESWAGHKASAESNVYARITGCGALQTAFGPTLALTPLAGLEGTTQTDAPSGFDGRVTVPQTSGFEEDATAHVRELSVALPQGLSVSPAAAQGLVGCQERGPEGINLGTTQIGPGSVDEGNPEATEYGAGHAGGNGSPYDDGQYHTAPGHCPAASIIASAEVFSPLVAKPLTGNVYVASPKCGGAVQPGCTGADAENGNLYSAYVELSGDGVIVKQPATISASQSTGQLTLHVRDMPQLPFNELKLRVHGGPRAPLANSQVCGTETTTSAFTPWSETSDVTPFTSYNVDWDGRGGACPATLPFAPGFAAGTVSATGGAYSPFVLSLTRQDREQNLAGLAVTLAPGLLAKLAGVAQCPDAQASAGSCPSASQIGTVTVAAGAGSTPLYVSGRIYLTGPYKGGPFGEAVVVPAVAGPFNLGDVVVRGSIHVDPSTAQATVVSDPFPTILDGVPLRVKTVNVTLDRPGFTFNPTNCSPQQSTGTVRSTQGAAVSVSSPFTAVNCAILPFKPSFSASTAGSGGLHGASLDVRVAQKPGEANIRKVAVQLPLALPSRLETLQKACTESQFAANPAGCPAGSVVGTAMALTPLLNTPLSGPAYLVAHGGAAFPDLEIVLQGEGVTIALVGNTDIKRGITYSRFETIPDAPISSFELKLPGGSGAVLGALNNLCAPTRTVTVERTITKRVRGHSRKVTVKFKRLIPEPLVMPTTITGQNGAVIHQNTRIAVTGCTKPNLRAKKARKATRPRNARKHTHK